MYILHGKTNCVRNVWIKIQPSPPPKGHLLTRKELAVRRHFHVDSIFLTKNVYSSKLYQLPPDFGGSLTDECVCSICFSRLRTFPVINTKILGGLFILPQEHSSSTALKISQLGERFYTEDPIAPLK